MAVVQLADIYEPVPFNAAVDQAAIELNRFVGSGILAGNPIIAAAANQGGSIGELPFFNPLDHSAEPNYVTDNPASFSVPKKIGGSKQTYRKAFLHDSWSTMDLALELALKDPFAAITSKIGKYWAIQIEKRVIQCAMGLLADNVANDGGDMVYNIATDAIGAPADAELISADAIILATDTMGDHKEALAIIAIHSAVYSRLQRLNLISFIPNSRGEINIPTYLGYLVIVDDSLPAVAGVNRITYTSFLFARGAFAYSPGTPTTPSELERIASSGDGGGQDVIHSRRTELIHINGTQHTVVPVGQSATLAELAAATSWDRVVDRKNIPIAFLQTNG